MFGINCFTEMCSGSEEGSYLRLIDFVVSFNSRNKSNKEERRALHFDNTQHSQAESTKHTNARAVGIQDVRACISL